MNEDELRLMVDRARRAETSTSQPPMWLIGEARAAARRHRRMVALAASGAMALAIVSAVAVPRLLDGDSAEPLPTASSHELRDHGGPCPSVLPTSTEDRGYGFGTSTPAGRGPRFGSPDSAWVCQYVLGDAVWELQDSPRRLDDTLLGQVVTSLSAVRAPESSSDGCTDDLGPRWMLVTSTDGDLTGVAVDDFGCRHVRLTDDPFVTAPGDPQGGGTVPGVLDAPGLAGTLEDWWNTSPADVDSSPTPDELRVTCTDEGPLVESTTVAARPAGVVLTVDSTMPKGSYLTYDSDGLSGGDNLRQIPSPATYTFPPGTLTIDCRLPDMDEVAPVEIEVVDPHGYWRPETLADVGCSSNAIVDWAVGPTEGATDQEAVDALLAEFATAAPPDRDVTDYAAEPVETGYSGAVTQTWLATYRGRLDFSIDVTRAGATYSAMPNVRCD